MSGKKKAITLLELCIAMLIVGVLATIGIQHWGVVYEKAIVREARAQLRLIRQAEEFIRVASNSYVACGPATVDCNQELGLDLPTKEWTYTVAPADATTFTAEAARNFGSWSACVYEITEGTDPPQPEVAADCLAD